MIANADCNNALKGISNNFLPYPLKHMKILKNVYFYVYVYTDLTAAVNKVLKISVPNLFLSRGYYNSFVANEKEVCHKHFSFLPNDFLSREVL